MDADDLPLGIEDRRAGRAGQRVAAVAQERPVFLLLGGIAAELRHHLRLTGRMVDDGEPLEGLRAVSRKRDR